MSARKTATTRAKEPSRAAFWATIVGIALALPVPLALGMGLMTGVFTGSGREAMSSLVSYYLLWLVVDSIGIAWTVFRHRNDV